MKPLLLVVEDNSDLLFNLRLMLEDNEYRVVTADGGLDALKNLSNLETVPDIIVSDINMPKMDGYDFFKAVSEDPRWNNIPFIFLTALTSPEEVRFGKMLGVDDYVLKPFEDKDLLASIAGKIARRKKIESINKKIGESFKSPELKALPSTEVTEKQSVILLYEKWDDKAGPQLVNHYPPNISLQISLDILGYQLFNSVSSIYGQDLILDAHGIMLNIRNIQKQGYTYFDAIPETNTRGKQLPFMLAVITKKIGYFNSLQIKEVLSEISIKIKQREAWEIKNYWERISRILSTSILQE